MQIWEVLYCYTVHAAHTLTLLGYLELPSDFGFYSISLLSFALREQGICQPCDECERARCQLLKLLS